MLFVNNFYYAANAEQRGRYLPKVLSGEWIGAMGMTEPSGGTDVLGMKTIARRDGDGYVLNGRKTFITNAPDARHLPRLRASSTDASPRSWSSAGSPASPPSSPTHKMGMRASTMGELIFDDCRVPAENLLGARGRRHHAT